MQGVEQVGLMRVDEAWCGVLCCTWYMRSGKRRRSLSRARFCSAAAADSGSSAAERLDRTAASAARSADELDPPPASRRRLRSSCSKRDAARRASWSADPRTGSCSPLVHCGRNGQLGPNGHLAARSSRPNPVARLVLWLNRGAFGRCGSCGTLTVSPPNVVRRAPLSGAEASTPTDITRL